MKPLAAASRKVKFAMFWGPRFLVTFFMVFFARARSRAPLLGVVVVVGVLTHRVARWTPLLRGFTPFEREPNVV